MLNHSESITTRVIMFANKHFNGMNSINLKAIEHGSKLYASPLERVAYFHYAAVVMVTIMTPLLFVGLFLPLFTKGSQDVPDMNPVAVILTSSAGILMLLARKFSQIEANCKLDKKMIDNTKISFSRSDLLKSLFLGILFGIGASIFVWLKLVSSGN